jgi:hypothetical protein
MKFINKDPRFRSPPGLERAIFRKLPIVLLGSTVVPLLMSLLVRVLPSVQVGPDLEKHYHSIDILAFAIGLTLWTAVFTVAIGCIIVIVMKGPRFTADSYKLDERNYPEEREREKSDS